MTACSDCGGTVIEYDSAAGNGTCVKCGTVVEENTIVNEVAFGESSSGAAIVQGAYVAHGSTHARMGGPFGGRGSSESREQTIANASRKIFNVANVLRLSEVISASAIRLYTLAVEHKFTKGRKNMNVIAVCLYVACRQKESRKYMLIDFSDLLQVNVFELGHTYLQLVQTLNLRLPLVDPSHYIARFASLLEFGEQTQQVAADATRLVQRFSRDWLALGRRPAGICGACLLLAARMNNFRRSVAEVVQVVRIADTTLKRRLDEFKKTPSGALTLADFRTVWLEEEVDPPAYTKGRERELRESSDKGDGSSEEDDGHESEGSGRGKKKRKKKVKRKKRRKREETTEDEENVDGKSTKLAPSLLDNGLDDDIPIDPQLLHEGFIHGTSDSLFLPETLGEASTIEISTDARSGGGPNSPLNDTLDVEADEILMDEVNHFLQAPQGVQLNDELNAAEEEQRRRAQENIEDDLLGLDEAELDAFLMTDDEVKIKERVWVELNRDYLEALAAKGEPKDPEAPKTRKRRRTSNKPRDASTPSGSTPGESVRNLIKKNPKYSKRINYDALRDLFDGDASALVPPPEVDLDEKEDEMYHLSENENEKDDGEGMDIVVEEGGGGVGVAPSKARRMSAAADGNDPDAECDGDDKIEGDMLVGYEEGYVDGDDYGWDDTYEQEV